MSQISTNIKDRRIRLGMTQTELAMRTGYSDKSMISQIESGKIDLPLSRVEVFARALRTTIPDLLGWGEPNERFTTTRINVYSSVHAGIPDEMIDDVVDFEDIPSSWNGEYFGVKVKGDCMIPKYLPGDTIIVRVQPDCESGQDVIARVNGDDAVLRTLDKAGSAIILRPLNPAYPADVYTENDPITICGVVVELRRKI